MKLITFILGTFLLLASPLLAANKGLDTDASAGDAKPFITLASQVVVDTDTIRLGDIFQGVDPKLMDKVVAYAPRPGSRSSFDSLWLRRVAAAYNLKWRPSSRMDRVNVERSSRVVMREEIEKLLHSELVQQGRDESSQAVLSNKGLRLYLPTYGIEPLRIEQFNIDQSSNRFTAQLAWGSSPDERARLSGRVQRMAQVPVLSNRIMRGNIISQSDIRWISMPQARLSRTAIIDIDGIVGMSAKHALQVGKPISGTDIRHPLLVNRGETVTMLLTTPSMQLSAKGRALQAGSKGETIRISNLQTNTVIDAVVTGSNLVRVNMSVNLAMR